MSQYHTPVLLEESVGLLGIDPAGTYVDLTFGGAATRAVSSKNWGPKGGSMPSTRIATRSPTPPPTDGSTTSKAIFGSCAEPSGCAG